MQFCHASPNPRTDRGVMEVRSSQSARVEILLYTAIFKGTVDPRTNVVSRRESMENMEFSRTRDERSRRRPIDSEKENGSMWDRRTGYEEDSIRERTRHLLYLHCLRCDTTVAPRGDAQGAENSEQLLNEGGGLVTSRNKEKKAYEFEQYMEQGSGFRPDYDTLDSVCRCGRIPCLRQREPT